LSHTPAHRMNYSLSKGILGLGRQPSGIQFVHTLTISKIDYNEKHFLH
jgi:hypothetical protein